MSKTNAMKMNLSKKNPMKTNLKKNAMKTNLKKNAMKTNLKKMIAMKI